MRLSVFAGRLFAHVLLLSLSRTVTSRQIRVRCASPDVIANGSYRIRRNGMLMRVSCQEGFSLQGPRVVDCVHGKWFGERPVCAKKGCAATSLSVENGQVQIENELKAILFCSEAHNLAGNRFSYCNGTHWDRQLGNCRARTDSIEYSCDFETDDVCGWVYENNNNYGWRRVMAANMFTTFQTGPRHDHTTRQANGGHYMLMETVGSGRDTAPVASRLMSPIYEHRLTLRTSCCFRFFYFMYGSDVGNLSVFLRPVSVPVDEMLAQKDLYMHFFKSGNQNNLWNEARFSIDEITEDFQIVFVATGGQSHLSDIAIDDVKLITGDECSSKDDASDELDTTTAELPPLYDVQSCVSRCSEASGIGVIRGRQGQLVGLCNCHVKCENDDSCCPDYRAVCLEDMFVENSEQRTTDENLAMITKSTGSSRLLMTSTASTTTMSMTTRKTTSASTPRTTERPTAASTTKITPTTTTTTTRTTTIRTHRTTTTTPRSTTQLSKTTARPISTNTVRTMTTTTNDQQKQTKSWLVDAGAIEVNHQTYHGAHGAQMLNLMFVLLGGSMVLGAIWYRCEAHLLALISKCLSADRGGQSSSVTAKFKMVNVSCGSSGNEASRNHDDKLQTNGSTPAEGKQSEAKPRAGSLKRLLRDNNDDTANLLGDLNNDELDLDFVDFTLPKVSVIQ